MAFPHTLPYLGATQNCYRLLAISSMTSRNSSFLPLVNSYSMNGSTAGAGFTRPKIYFYPKGATPIFITKAIEIPELYL